MKKLIGSPALAMLAVGGLVACAGGDTGAGLSSAMSPSGAMSPDSAMSPSGAMPSDKMMAMGKYIGYDEYSNAGMMAEDGPVVLFFNASWCPDCQAIDMALKQDPSKIPAGATIVGVDYDSHDDLRKKYGVTMQHTFVQVDAQQNAVNTWNATAVDDIASGIRH